MAKTKTKKLDTERLAAIAARIAAFPDPTHPDLLHELEQEQGMKQPSPRGGRGMGVRVAMAGLTSKPAPSLGAAITNWANAARRSVANAGR